MNDTPASPDPTAASAHGMPPTRRPRAPHGLQFARMAVPDIDATIDFYREHVGLDLVDREPTRATLRADVEHHCLELLADPSLEAANVMAIGFNVEDDEVLDDLAHRLGKSGYATFDLDARLKGLCSNGFAVNDPNGLTIELFTEFQVFAEPPLIELRPLDIVHPFISSDRYEASLAFYCDTLGFLPSDYIADQTAFLRTEDRYHHSFAVRRDKRFYVAHLCFRMKSFDHVMRGRARALYKKVPIASDLVNHSASRSLAFYMHDPRHGPRIELCDGHLVFSPEEHETHKPRRMSVDPRNIDVWRAAADDWENF